MGLLIFWLIVTAITSVSIAIYRNKKDNRGYVNYKAPVGNNKREPGNPALCPQCGKMSTFVPPAKKISDDEVESTFECPDGHVYTLVLPIK